MNRVSRKERYAIGVTVWICVMFPIFYHFDLSVGALVAWVIVSEILSGFMVYWLEWQRRRWW